MLSLVLGSEITDASVAAIASSYSSLELLDLSGCVLLPAPFVLRFLKIANLMECVMIIAFSLDVSRHRSSISDNGIGMICNEYPETLSKLLLALCPNITSSNIQICFLDYPSQQLVVH